MIDFNEELKKFRPSLEVDNAKEAITGKEVTDLSSIMKKMLALVEYQKGRR